MSTDVSTQTREHIGRSHPEWPAFSAHHGIMARGTRLFRVIGFSAKTAWVSAAFLVPILPQGCGCAVRLPLEISVSCRATSAMSPRVTL